MALTFTNRARLTIPLVDATGSTAQFQINFRVLALTDLPSVATAVVGGVPTIEALSGGSARGVTLSLQWREDDITSPAPESRVERVGRWDLINTEGRTFSVSIPAIRSSLVDTNGYIIRSNPLVAAFETFLLQSSACDDRGVEVGGVRDAREIYRASKRRAPRVRG